MKILMLTPYLPYPLLSGGQIRTYNLLKKLANKHEVTLFSLIKDNDEKKYIPELEKYCKNVRVFKRSSKPFTLKNILKTAFSSYPFLVIRNHAPEIISAVEEELAKNKYDLIHAETFYMMPHIPKTTIPTILVEQTIEYLGYESYAKKASFLIRAILTIDINKIRRWEKHYWKVCDTLIVMSEDDKKYISKEIKESKKIEVVANGIDTKWFEEVKKTKHKDPTLLSVGTFKWLPNVEAVEFLVKRVWPLIKKELPNAKLWIVGNAPTENVYLYEKRDPSIKVIGRIPDIRDAFSGVDVLMAPVFSGKGTRYKVLEAMASETPIVSTSTAVEGLNVKNGVHVMIDNTEQGMATLAIELLNNPEKRKNMAQYGKKFVKNNYDWSLISNKLDIIYKRIGSK
ncbi:MAG: glycosyltransferase [Candidatus Pacebacteria bacterium]|nr:glycosyltransferase [Candidatus Pacearchaeota archaeon]NCS86711.1 glycosyltransferase [Candidatus Paceibacterota bacterium]